MFCTYCGEKNQSKNKFCENCGKPLQAKSGASQTVQSESSSFMRRLPTLGGLIVLFVFFMPWIMVSCSGGYGSGEASAYQMATGDYSQMGGVGSSSNAPDPVPALWLLPLLGIMSIASWSGTRAGLTGALVAGVLGLIGMGIVTIGFQDFGRELNTVGFEMEFLAGYWGSWAGFATQTALAFLVLGSAPMNRPGATKHGKASKTGSLSANLQDFTNRYVQLDLQLALRWLGITLAVYAGAIFIFSALSVYSLFQALLLIPIALGYFYARDTSKTKSLAYTAPAVNGAILGAAYFLGTDIFGLIFFGGSLLSYMIVDLLIRELLVAAGLGALGGALYVFAKSRGFEF